MARKNPFASLMEKEAETQENPVSLDYTIKGASRSIISSIDEMAARADKLLEGETIVEIDPNLVDDSFSRDRFDLDDPEYAEEYAKVRDAIETRGQDSPALLRPHPQQLGRYMLVFGHLRKRAALELGRKLRAVIRDISDRDHVISQGQENASRANTSFIEKARWATDIVDHQFDTDNSTVLEALRVNAPTLSKMLAVGKLPDRLLDAIGRAKKTGRDRWYELKLLLDRPGNLEKALAAIEEPEFASLGSDERFAALYDRVKKSNRRARPKQQPETRSWTPADRRVEADIVGSERKFTIALKAKSNDALAFGNFVSENLGRLYEEFRSEKNETQDGD